MQFIANKERMSLCVVNLLVARFCPRTIIKQIIKLTGIVFWNKLLFQISLTHIILVYFHPNARAK